MKETIRPRGSTERKKGKKKLFSTSQQRAMFGNVFGNRASKRIVVVQEDSPLPLESPPFYC